MGLTCTNKECLNYNIEFSSGGRLKNSLCPLCKRPLSVYRSETSNVRSGFKTHRATMLVMRKSKQATNKESRPSLRANMRGGSKKNGKTL